MYVPTVSTKWLSKFILGCLSPLLYQMAFTIYTRMSVPPVNSWPGSRRTVLTNNRAWKTNNWQNTMSVGNALIWQHIHYICFLTWTLHGQAILLIGAVIQAKPVTATVKHLLCLDLNKGPPLHITESQESRRVDLVSLYNILSKSV